MKFTEEKKQAVLRYILEKISQQDPRVTKTVSETMDINQNTVHSYISELIDQGVIRRVKRGQYELVRKQEISVEPKCELTEEKALELSKKLEGLKRGDLVRVTYYDTYGYRSRTGILDEVLPAFKLLKLRDIAIGFDDIQDIELRGRA